MGCDFAGDIAALGKDAEGKGFKVGDAVAGFLRGGIPDSANGSFQGTRVVMLGCFKSTLLLTIRVT